MANLDLTAFDAALKELHTDQSLMNAVCMDMPGFAMIKKKTDFYGRSKPLPIKSANSAGRSATFSTGQANQVAGEYNAFLLTRKKDYGFATIENEVLFASSNNLGAFMDAATENSESAIDSLKLSLGGAIFRNGTGSIGKIAAGGITSGVITLDDPESVTQFQLNQTLQAAATDGATPRAALGYVIAVNSDAGTITVSDASIGGAAGSPSAWAAADFLLVQGDSNAKIAGFEAWLPASAPSSALFFNVDRTTSDLLGGSRYNGAGYSIDEALIDGASKLYRKGGKPSVVLTNFTSYAALEKSLGSRVRYCETKSQVAGISFKGIELVSPQGTMAIIPDRHCPGQVAYMLTLEDWTFESLGPAPRLLLNGKGQILDVYNQDAVEFRVGYYGNLACRCPGRSSRITLGA